MNIINAKLSIHIQSYFFLTLRFIFSGLSFIFSGMFMVTSLSLIAEQAGDLDVTFGTNGIEITKQLWINQPNFVATGLVLRTLPNDILVSAARFDQPPANQSILVSYKKTDGQLNVGSFGPGNPAQGYSNWLSVDRYQAVTSFIDAGINGLMVVGSRGAATAPQAVAIRADTLTGAVIVASNITTPQGLFNSVITDQENQYIFAAGNTLPNRSFRFARFNFSDLIGSLRDTITNFSGSSAGHINSAALQSDGRVIVAGQTTNATIPQFTLGRYKSDATLDLNFADSGRVIVLENESEANAITMQTAESSEEIVSEKIVAVGWIKINSNQQNLVLVRYHLDGRPDTSFGPDKSGIVKNSFNGKSVTPHAIAIDKNNKIVVAGEFLETSESKPVFILARYTSNGLLDRSFGPDANGWVTTAPTQNGCAINAIAIDENNKIICGGYSINNNGKYEITLARYIGSSPNFGSPGTIDTDFGQNGLTTTDFSTAVSFFASTVTPLSGSTPLPAPVSKNFTPNPSTLTPSLVPFFTHKQPKPTSSSFTDTQSNFASTQSRFNRLLNRSLSVPNSFIQALRAKKQLTDKPRKRFPKKRPSKTSVSMNNVAGTNSSILGIALREAPNNDILVVGQRDTAPYSQIIASYTGRDGTLNTGNFGSPLSQGYTNYRTDTANAGNALIASANSAVITVGSLVDQQNIAKATVFIFTNTASSLQGSFQVANGALNAAAMGHDNGINYAGVSQTPTITTSKNFLVSKYNTISNPTITNFTGSSNDISEINASALYQNRKIVVAGTAVIDGQNRFVVARYLSNGQLDTTFNGTGKAVADFSKITLVSDRNDTAYGVALQQIDGEFKIVVVGATARKHGGHLIALVRYNDNGTLDPTFGYPGTGIRVNCFGSNSDEARAVVIDQNNKIVIAGMVATKISSNTDPVKKFLVARYTQNGNIDRTFAGNGRVFTRFFGKGAGANAIALQMIDGSSPRIIAAGFALDDDGHSRFALARYFA